MYKKNGLRKLRSPKKDESLANLVDSGIVRNRGHSLGVVVNLDSTVSNLGLQSLVVSNREVGQRPGIGGQTNIIALGQIEIGNLAAVCSPVAIVQLAQNSLGDVLQLLHGRGDNQRGDVGLVNVNADNLAVVLLSSFQSGGVDAAAAGKDDLSTALVPAFHLAVISGEPENWPPYV